MTNFEKYKDELMKTKGDFGFSKTKQKIGVCGWVNNNIETVKCEDCLFDEPSTCCCDSEKVEWLCKEYKEPILSDDELELVKVLSKINEKKYKYIARNGGRVFLFSDKPPIDKYGVRFTDKCNYIIIDDRKDAKNLFLNIKYEDGLYDIENKCFIKE